MDSPSRTPSFALFALESVTWHQLGIPGKATGGSHCQSSKSGTERQGTEAWPAACIAFSMRQMLGLLIFFFKPNHLTNMQKPTGRYIWTEALSSKPQSTIFLGGGVGAAARCLFNLTLPHTQLMGPAAEPA